MKSEWRVSKIPVVKGYVYVVYRLLDVQKTDHSGNREELWGTWEDRSEAERVAKQKNEEEEKKWSRL